MHEIHYSVSVLKVFIGQKENNYTFIIKNIYKDKYIFHVHVSWIGQVKCLYKDGYDNEKIQNISKSNYMFIFKIIQNNMYI